MPWARAAAVVAALVVDNSQASRRAFPARLTLVSPRIWVHCKEAWLTNYLTEIDNLTDRAGLGDKYDDKIDKFADGQINNQIPGGAGNNAGGSGGGLGGLGK
jgi:hypothetical protein